MRFSILTLIFVVALSAVSHSADEDIFIPYDPYDPTDREFLREDALRRGNCSEAFIDAMLDHAEKTGYLFSIEAVSKSVPSILNSDELNIGCPGQAMRMEFISVMSSNTTMVRTMVCTHQADGMMCTPPDEGLRYFFDDPRKTIELSDDISFADATKIYDWFRTDAGAELSDSEKTRMRQLAWNLVITKDDDIYQFAIGEPECECVFEASLQIPDINSIKPSVAMVERQFVCPGSR